ncbi:TRAP transporter large permease [Aeromicrobium sp. CTD01-1L150]|uniref:TRAP transporter large permease n=1 Tax=Aeromicrobium sp. CTD01-1L150 TaxID=3341830 RepID=UPI0035BFB99D
MPVIAGAILLLLILATPIGVAFALPTILGAESLGMPANTFAASVPNETAQSFALVAIPYFLLAGQAMQRGGLMERLITLAHSVLGWLRGALGYVTIAASAMLGAITGSSVATVATMGATVGRSMVSTGYARPYVASLTAACGLLGALIPPSIPLVVYSSASGVAVSDLFIATIVPGLLMTGVFMVVHRLLIPRLKASGDGLGGAQPAAPGGTGAAAHVDVKQARTAFGPALVKAMPALLMPVILLGGIYSGVMTPTESAAVAGLYGLTAALVLRTLRWRALPHIFYAAALPTIAILSIIVFTSVFSRAITLERIPQGITDWALGITDNPLVFLLMINLVLLLVGMFMETNAAVLLMAPLLVPAAMAYDVDPVHFGIILVTNIELGLITPPLAANLFVASKTIGAPIMSMLRWIAPFFVAAACVQLAITYLPVLTTWHQS